MGDYIELSELTSRIVPSLVSYQTWADASFISLPMVYPGGSFVTVRLTHVKDGVRVSDSGFAFKEADSFGAGRSFPYYARSISENYDVKVGKRTVFVDVRPHEVERAIFDVSAASLAIAEKIVEKASQDTEINISDALHDRLEIIFREKVSFEAKLIGASQTEWDVSAVTNVDDQVTVFQAVTNWPVAVYKASTAFHDLAALENPPNLVSVVSSKEAMGKNYSILAQAGRVIEVGQPDGTFIKAAA